jgi:hypothetical protein
LGGDKTLLLGLGGDKTLLLGLGGDKTLLLGLGGDTTTSSFVLGVNLTFLSGFNKALPILPVFFTHRPVSGFKILSDGQFFAIFNLINVNRIIILVSNKLGIFLDKCLYN